MTQALENYRVRSIQSLADGTEYVIVVQDGDGEEYRESHRF